MTRSAARTRAAAEHSSATRPLAPLRALFLGGLLCEVTQTHLSAELEVMLPAGTH